jgi:hypothetical protein
VANKTATADNRGFESDNKTADPDNRRFESANKTALPDNSRFDSDNKITKLDNDLAKRPLIQQSSHEIKQKFLHRFEQ